MMIPSHNSDPARANALPRAGTSAQAWQWAVFAVCAGAVLAGTGCVKKTVHAAPNLSAAASASRPRLPAKRPHPAGAVLDAPPDLQIVTLQVITLPVVRTAPPRPHNGTGLAPTTTDPEPVDSRPAPPQLSPSMSPQEQAAAQKQTNESIGAAEHHLQSALGRQLTPTQSDLVEKIRGFLGQAREAIRDGDWLRARTLAQKAQVLSAELANSL
ncbi:MAG TPA: hypothetical protein VEU31_07595 [Candidatus Acidoferrales bacterium]|nr:hypothetical protein [Candidatus Acidoferrales bacterium]